MRRMIAGAASIAALFTVLSLSLASAQVVPALPVPPLPDKQPPDKQPPAAPPPAQVPPLMPEQDKSAPPPAVFEISLVGTWDGVLSSPYGYNERQYIIFYDNAVFDSYITSYYVINGQIQPLFNLRVWGTYAINATDKDAGFVLAQPQGAQPSEICAPNMPCQAVPMTPSQVPFQLDAAGSSMSVQTNSGMKGTLKRVK